MPQANCAWEVLTIQVKKLITIRFDWETGSPGHHYDGSQIRLDFECPGLRSIDLVNHKRKVDWPSSTLNTKDWLSTRLLGPRMIKFDNSSVEAYSCLTFVGPILIDFDTTLGLKTDRDRLLYVPNLSNSSSMDLNWSRSTIIRSKSIRLGSRGAQH